MNRENLVAKHNKLIEAKGHMEFTKLEQKLFLAVVSEISSTEDKDLTIYPINIKEFLGLTGHKSIGGEQHTQVHDTAKRLMQKVITIRNWEDTGYLTTAFLASAETTDDGEYVEIEVSKKLKPYLIELEGCFTRYQLQNILKFNSGYSIRIYELLKQREDWRNRTFDVDELKEFLGIGGKYERFYDFERYVLKVAKEEINEHTDIDIDYEKIKRGRRITHIAFSIRPSVKDRYSEQLEELYSDKEQYQAMVDKMNLSDKKLNKKQITELYMIACDKTLHLESKGVNVYDYVKINVEYANEKAPDNYYAYLKKALEKDFGRAITLLKLLNRKEQDNG